MFAFAKVYISPARVLEVLGEGLPVAHLSAGAVHVLERLEEETARMWRMPVSKSQNELLAKCRLFQGVYPAFEAKRRQLQLSAPILETLWRIYLPLARWVVVQAARNPESGFILGVNGAQGAGKSTLCALLQCLLEIGFGQRVAVLSLDDFYLTRLERQRLAREVHPLLVTRGVPGTHDVTFAIRVLSALRSQSCQESIRLPLFNKALDDRLPKEKWPVFQGHADILLFEGWCVGARPEPGERLAAPINPLEAEEDSCGIWRQYVNRVLAEQYQPLFNLLDGLLFLKVPGFKVVYKQRLEQEQRLAQKLRQERGEAVSSTEHAMGRQELRHFIMHFQRLTEYMLEDLPSRADLILALNESRQFYHVTRNSEAPFP